MGGVTALTVTATARLTRMASSCDNGGPQALHFNANLNCLSVSGQPPPVERQHRQLRRDVVAEARPAHLCLNCPGAQRGPADRDKGAAIQGAGAAKRACSPAPWMVPFCRSGETCRQHAMLAQHM
ncbi:unnamed protein product [Arctogadus glacialis]